MIHHEDNNLCCDYDITEAIPQYVYYEGNYELIQYFDKRINSDISDDGKLILNRYKKMILGKGRRT